MKVRPLALGLMVGTLAVPGARAQTGPPAVVLSQPIRSTGAGLDVNLQGAGAAALGQTLGTALGGTVRIDGPLPAPVTLDLRGMPAHAALDRLAGALHGSWRPIYTVTLGAAAAAARHPVPLGRTVTANLDHVSARAAFALVARAAGGTLDAPPKLDQPVTLSAKEIPIEQALDDLARQTGAAWSVTFVLKAGVAPPMPAQHAPPEAGSPRSLTLSRAPVVMGSGLRGALSSDRRAFPLPFGAFSPGGAPGSGDDARTRLTQGLTQVMRMPEAVRGPAVKELAAQLDEQFRQMLQLPPAGRIEQMNAMRPVYQAALRTYNGLVPAQRREFQPIIDVFSRWIR